MGAALLVVRSELRRRAATWLVLGLVVAIGVGAGLAGLAGARRTASATPRFLAAADAPELIVDVVPWELDDPDAFGAELRALPGVTGSADAAAFGVARFVDGRPDLSYPSNFLAPLDDRRYRTEDRPALAEGRLPDPAAGHEVLVNTTFAEEHDVGVGDVLELGYVTAEQVADWYELDTPFDPTDATFEVVGVGFLPEDLLHDELTAEPVVVGTLAWATAHPEGELWRRVGLQLAPGADPRDVESAAQDLAVQVGAGGLLVEDRTVVTAEAQRATRPFALALALVGGVALLAAAAIVAQGVARAVDLARDDLPAFRAMGAPTAARAVAVLGAGSITVLAGLLGAVVVAVTLSPLSPVGPTRAIEPDPGLAVDATVVGLGTLAALVVVALRVVPAGLALARHRRTDRSGLRSSALADLVARTGVRPAVTVGVRAATEPGGGRTRAPARAAVAGVALAVAALVAVVAFDSGRRQLLDDPAAYGWTWDAAVQAEGGYGELDLEAIAADPDVVGVAAASFAPVRVDGHDVPGLALSPLVGDAAPRVLEGRAPAQPDEVALGSDTMRLVGASIGDRVTLELGSAEVDGGAGDELVVVGEVVLPALGFTDTARPGLGRGALMVLSLDEAGGAAGTALLHLDPSTDLAEPGGLAARFADPVDDVKVVTSVRPADLAGFDRLGAGPLTVLSLFGLAAVTATIHGVVTSVRRRRRDLAVLRAIGFEDGQMRTVVTAQTATIVVVALLVGIPVGLVAGRWAWRSLAADMGVSHTASHPVVATAVLACGLLAVALIASLLPARSAVRSRPSHTLRTE